MRIKPTFDNVVLEKRDGKKKGNIILPGLAAEERKGWYVVEIGPDVKCVKKDDQIAFNNRTDAGQMELENGKKYVVMGEKDIVGVIVS